MRLLGKTVILSLLLLNMVWAGDFTQVCFRNNVCVEAEISDTDASRQKGLMFRNELASSEAMLFVFDTEVLASFWLKNVKFPLDIIWIDTDKTVVYIKTDAPPCQDNCASYATNIPAKYALEVNAGFVRKNQIEIGDKLAFNLP